MVKKKLNFVCACFVTGRCSIVDYYGNVVADIYAQPEDRITDYRTRWSGIRKHHLKSAIPFDIARQKVKQILKVCTPYYTCFLSTKEKWQRHTVNYL